LSRMAADPGRSRASGASNPNRPAPRTTTPDFTCIDSPKGFDMLLHNARITTRQNAVLRRCSGCTSLVSLARKERHCRPCRAGVNARKDSL
jgi:hypothetical protein